MEPWLLRAGYQLTTTRFFESEPLPSPAEIDLLIIMGGPMSVNDEREFPWLGDEKRFIREVISTDKAVLGVCLGAQLIASALGARVYPNPAKEIGWFPVFAEPCDSGAVFSFPPTALVFHWHGETFDLPAGAVRLARSQACRNQAFQVGASVIGLQFHLETTPESARQMVSHCRGELASSRFVESEAEILAADADRYASIHALMDRVLAFLVRHKSRIGQPVF
jgi:GMP synthase-like glutamine amidotransferase